MPREKELFRPYIERLDQVFPNKEILSQKECAAFAGCCTITAKKHFGVGRNGIAKLDLAKKLAEERQVKR